MTQARHKVKTSWGQKPKAWRIVGVSCVPKILGIETIKEFSRETKAREDLAYLRKYARDHVWRIERLENGGWSDAEFLATDHNPTKQKRGTGSQIWVISQTQKPFASSLAHETMEHAQKEG